MKLLRKLRNKIDEISRAADNQLYWDSLSRKIGPTSIKESPEFLPFQISGDIQQI